MRREARGQQKVIQCLTPDGWNWHNKDGRHNTLHTNILTGVSVTQRLETEHLASLAPAVLVTGLKVYISHKSSVRAPSPGRGTRKECPAGGFPVSISLSASVIQSVSSPVNHFKRKSPWLFFQHKTIFNIFYISFKRFSIDKKRVLKIQLIHKKRYPCNLLSLK